MINRWLVIFAAAPDDGVVFKHDVLKMLASLTDTAWQLPLLPQG